MPDSPAYAVAAEAAAEGLPITVPSVVLSEVSFGVARKLGTDPALANQYAWLLQLLEVGVLQPLALTVAAAHLAGELRALRAGPTDRAAQAQRGKTPAAHRLGIRPPDCRDGVGARLRHRHAQLV